MNNLIIYKPYKRKKNHPKGLINRKEFHRERSYWNFNFSQRWTIDWLTLYYDKDDNGYPEKDWEKTTQQLFKLLCMDGK